jgi:hypothetical protein
MLREKRTNSDFASADAYPLSMPERHISSDEFIGLVLSNRPECYLHLENLEMSVTQLADPIKCQNPHEEQSRSRRSSDRTTAARRAVRERRPGGNPRGFGGGSGPLPPCTPTPAPPPCPPPVARRAEHIGAPISPNAQQLSWHGREWPPGTGACRRNSACDTTTDVLPRLLA